MRPAGPEAEGFASMRRLPALLPVLHNRIERAFREDVIPFKRPPEAVYELIMQTPYLEFGFCSG